jgi:hypothetical protein
MAEETEPEASREQQAPSAAVDQETIGNLHFVANPNYPYPFKVAKPPRFWMEEQTGALEDAVETYMAGERLSATQLQNIKIYLRQFIERAPLTGDAKVPLLLQRVERLKTTREIEAFAEELAEYGAEVF